MSASSQALLLPRRSVAAEPVTRLGADATMAALPTRLAALLPDTPPAVVSSLPPWWAFLVLALPHLWYMWVLLHPSSTKRTAKLFKMEPVEWFSGIAVALNCAQIAAVLAFLITSRRFSASVLASLWAAQPWRAVALPLFAGGLVFKVSIFQAIGKKGVYYGAKFGHTIPWVHGFPFSVTGACQQPAPRRGGGVETSTQGALRRKLPSRLQSLPRPTPAPGLLRQAH